MQKLKQEVQTNVYTIYSAAVNAQRQWQLNDRALAEAGKIFDVSKMWYGLGLLTAQDLLLAKNTFEKANSDLLTAKYEWIFKRKLVLFYQAPVKR